MSAFEEKIGVLNLDELVTEYYQDVWRFAMSLVGNPADASDLTQQTFYLLQIRGHQIRDFRKAKGWLFTTLHREYLKARRHESRFPEFELSRVENELPTIISEDIEKMEAAAVLAGLQRLGEKLRTPISLFYIEGMSYKEIAEWLGVPAGTVMSRLSRGKMHLRCLLDSGQSSANIAGLRQDSVPSAELQEFGAL